MKITVTHDDGPVATLAALQELVDRATAIIDRSEGATTAATIKVNITPTRKVRNIEVTW